MDTSLKKEQTLRNSRTAALFASAATLAFSPLDVIVYPELAGSFLFLRLTAVAAGAVLFGISYLPQARDYGQDIGTAQYLISTLTVVLMIHRADGYLSPYYTAIIVVLMVFLAMIPLNHRRTAAVCSVVYTAYLVPILLRGDITDTAVFLHNNAILIAAMAVIVVSSWVYTARDNLAQEHRELKQMDLLKSQFFANVSHEVRTPLTSIIAPVQSIFQGDAGEISELQRRLLAQVYRNAIRLLDMINQMLDFARFDARKMRVRLSQVDLETVVRDTATVFADVAGQKGLSLTYEVEDEIPPLYLDREKLDRIITNLVRNAIKFTEEGEVTIRVGRDQNCARIVVADTGIGIPADQISTLFERFHQGDSSSTRRYDGTGLGLTIVKEATEIQHGTVEVKSIPDEGTAFTVRLPLDLEDRMPESVSNRSGRDRRKSDCLGDGSPYTGPERRRTPRRQVDFGKVELTHLAYIEAENIRLTDFDPTVHTADTGRADGDGCSDTAGCTVLYVEDNTDLRTYVQQMLTLAGHRVVTAVDGQDGWEKLPSVTPDVVVSDLMMPRLDGYDLLRRIREDETYQTIPVILTTARSETEERIRGLEEGADDYLAKPINIRELDARIRNLITRRLFQEALTKAAELERRMQDLTMGFSRSLDLRDHYTANHCNDVLFYGTIIAEELDITITPTFRDAMLLHDLGKLGVPDRVLLKEGPLNEDEWIIMKRHAEYGADLLAEFESFRDVSEIVLSHQERYDGTGYPRGLVGDDIPLMARIVAVADAWHAMIEDRPYRKAMDMSRALCELTEGRGTHFDPAVVDAFVRGLSRRGLINVSMD